MNIIESATTCFTKYSTFKGDASRSEFWWFQLLITLLINVGTVLDGKWIFSNDYDYNAPLGTWEFIFTLLVILPLIAVGCRRLHDVGKSGWWQLLLLTIVGVIPLIIWWCTEGRTTKKEIYKETNNPSPEDLKKWSELRDSGVITEEEFQKKKKEFI